MKTFATALIVSAFLLPLSAQDSPAPPQAKPVEPVAPAEPAPAPKSEPKPAAAPKTYTVKSGDNPWSIAKDHGVELAALLKANDIKDPKNLKIGDVLTLPDGATSESKPEAEKPAEKVDASAPAEPESGDGWKLYTIAKGDNPWKIAKSLGVEHQKIMKLNEGLDFTKLAIGQKIKVPTK